MHAILFALAIFVHQTAPPAAQATFVQRTTADDGLVTVQTGVHHLQAEGKPDVWLVGAVHIGEARYYKEVQSILDAQNVVLFEGVKPAKADPVPPSEPPKEGEAKPKGLYTVFSEVLGLEFQNTQISYKNPAWINSDLSWDEMQELNKKLPEGQSATFGTIQQLMDPNSSMAKTVTMFLQQPIPGLKGALKVFFVNKLGDPEAAKLISSDPGFSDIILEARNKSVESHFAALLQRPEPVKSVGIFYGAAHHPGLEAHLVSTYGYHLAESRWLSAASANPKSLDEDGKKMLKMLESTTKLPAPGGGGRASLR